VFDAAQPTRYLSCLISRFQFAQPIPLKLRDDTDPVLLVVATAQVAIYLHYRNSLDLATKEGAFQASLVGHQPKDGELATQELWTKVEPGGGRIDVTVARRGNLVRRSP